MKPTEKYLVPTWTEAYRMILRVAERIIADGFKPDIIVGVARGGLIPARVLSDLLEQPNLTTVRIECYVGSGKSKPTPVLTEQLTACVKGQKVLLVDDVADTGCSLKLAEKHIAENGAQETRIVTLFHKPWSTLKPDYSADETSLWVVFPWDIKETVRSAFENRENATHVELSEKLKSTGLPRSLVDKFLKEIVWEETC
jgi:uncharacterized protein